MVKKEVFEWICTGQKNIELRRGKAKKGDVAIFQCGRNILRRKIIKREEGNLTDVPREDSYKNIISSANTRARYDLLQKLSLVEWKKSRIGIKDKPFSWLFFESKLKKESFLKKWLRMIRLLVEIP